MAMKRSNHTGACRGRSDCGRAYAEAAAHSGNTTAVLLLPKASASSTAAIDG